LQKHISVDYCILETAIVKTKLGELMLWLIICFGFIFSKCFAAVSKSSCISTTLSGQ